MPQHLLGCKPQSPLSPAQVLLYGDALVQALFSAPRLRRFFIRSRQRFEQYCCRESPVSIDVPHPVHMRTADTVSLATFHSASFTALRGRLRPLSTSRSARGWSPDASMSPFRPSGPFPILRSIGRR